MLTNGVGLGAGAAWRGAFACSEVLHGGQHSPRQPFALAEAKMCVIISPRNEKTTLASLAAWFVCSFLSYVLTWK